MSDLYTLSLIAIGITACCAAVLIPLCRTPKPSVLPVIHRRRELQEELNALLTDEEATRIVREESTRRGRPGWDVEVLDACVRRATAIAAKRQAAQTKPTHARVA